MKNTVIILFIICSISVSSQTEEQKSMFNQYLIDNELPACFGGFNKTTATFFWGEKSITMGHNLIKSEYNEDLEILKLYIVETCDDKNVIEIKHLLSHNRDFLIVYEETDDHCCNFGEITKYEWLDSVWVKGNTLQMSWENLFELRGKKLRKLRKSGETPAAMFTFTEKGLYVELPWEYYSLSLDDEINGWLQASPRTPFTISYSQIINN